MPLYVYVCEPCRKSCTDIRRVDDRYLSPKCDRCSNPMKLEITAVPGIVRDPAVPKRK